MKKSYIKPDIDVIDIEAETLLMSVSDGDSLDGTGNGGDDYTGLDANAKIHNGYELDVWD